MLFRSWWLLSARRWFKGPVVQGTEDELAQIDEAYESGRAVPEPST